MKKLLLLIVSILAIFGGIFLVNANKPSVIEQPVKPPTDFSLIVLPDTQAYSKDYPEILKDQTQWIVDNKIGKNIVFVAQLGDLTDSWNDKIEWQNVSTAFSLLNGVVPYGLLPGNHDDPKMFNQFFPYTRFEKEAWWGGHYGSDNSNNYQLFSAENLNFIIVNLKINPSEVVLKWADSILKKYSDRRAIVATHYFLDYDGFRSPIGEQIYQAFSSNQNLFLILSGHSHAEARRTDRIDSRPIYQLLADYQVRPNGGNGFLRILRFSLAENKIYVQTYSPYLDQFETDDNSQFELEYEMD